jgi:hypothetical protein
MRTGPTWQVGPVRCSGANHVFMRATMPDRVKELLASDTHSQTPRVVSDAVELTAV